MYDIKKLIAELIYLTKKEKCGIITVFENFPNKGESGNKFRRRNSVDYITKPARS